MHFRKITTFPLLLILFFISSAEAGTVTSVNGTRVTIQLEPEEEILKFDHYYLISPSGKRRGMILISEVIDDEAWGTLKKGTAEEGWTIKYRGPVNPFKKNDVKNETPSEPAATVSDAPSNDEDNEPKARKIYFHENMLMEIDLISLLTLQVVPRLEFRLGDSFSIGPMISWAKYDFIFWEIEHFGYGLSAHYFFKDFRTSGFYLGADYQQVTEDIETKALVILNGKARGNIYSARVGYRWMFEDGWNMSLGYAHWFSSFKELEVENGLSVQRKQFFGDYGRVELAVGCIF